MCYSFSETRMVLLNSAPSVVATRKWNVVNAPLKEPLRLLSGKEVFHSKKIQGYRRKYEFPPGSFFIKQSKGGFRSVKLFQLR